MTSAVKRKAEEVGFDPNKRTRPASSAVAQTAKTVQEYTQVQSFFLTYPGGARNFAFDVHICALMQILPYQRYQDTPQDDIFADTPIKNKIMSTCSLITHAVQSNCLASYFTRVSRFSEFPQAALDFIQIQYIMDLIQIPCTWAQRALISEGMVRGQPGKYPLGIQSLAAKEVDDVIFSKFISFYITRYTYVIGQLTKHSLQLGNLFFLQENDTFWNQVGLTKDLRRIVYEYTFDPFEGSLYSNYLADMRFYAQKLTATPMQEVTKKVHSEETHSEKRKELTDNLNDMTNFLVQMNMISLMKNKFPATNAVWHLGEYDRDFTNWLKIDLHKTTHIATRMVQNPEIPRDVPNLALLRNNMTITLPDNYPFKD